jgi:hypothetical protein
MANRDVGGSSSSEDMDSEPPTFILPRHLEALVSPSVRELKALLSTVYEPADFKTKARVERYIELHCDCENEPARSAKLVIVTGRDGADFVVPSALYGYRFLDVTSIDSSALGGLAVAQRLHTINEAFDKASKASVGFVIIRHVEKLSDLATDAEKEILKRELVHQRLIFLCDCDDRC